ncbi:hypothetical protein Pmani_011562 [Petrolisthes manimaculis]|uniref:Uncharacterized protein n=1 Tax=Petrolisthes manimaculis TaxID=1843537 RepID=A0AAE1Q0W8_9EUCA|nr:hypothetical protein Pmani_011562 [Petrolisthes manimaculis]
MKTTFVLVACLAALAFVRGEGEPSYCRCANFVSSRHSEIMVLELPSVDVADCNAHNQCKNRCTTEIGEMTNDMDLWSTVDDVNVGQYFCTQLYDNFFFWIHNSYIHGYYELCGGPWEYTGQDSQQMLCCSGGTQQHCVTK